MLAGGIGGCAINVLNSWGIGVVRGCSGIAVDAVNKLVSGTLTDSCVSCHQHKGHGHQCSN